MKVGLVRHFKVTLGYPNKFVTSTELMNWQKEYDESALEETEIDLQEIDWKRCYSSDLERARQTAEIAFDGEIIFLENLRELTLAPIIRSNHKLPLWFHIFLIRIAWLCGHKSQKETKKQVEERIKNVLDEALKHKEDVLIVGHGGIMMLMRKELIKRGFTGPKFKTPKNAQLYTFSKSLSL